MEKWIRECHKCGEAIPSAEFERHRAVMIMKRNYCGACADRITRRKAPFHALALPVVREHPRLAAGVVLTLALLALLAAFLAVHPPR